MNTARRVAKNTVVLFTAQIISYVFAFFGNMYMARYLGADGYGVISLALALTGIYAVFTDLGLGTVTTREVARDKSLKDKYIVNTFIIKVFLAFFTMALTVLTVNLLGYSQEIKEVVYIITVSIILTAFSGIFTSVFQALEKMEYQSLGSIISSAVMLVGILVAIHFNLSLTVFALLYIVSSAIILIYLASLHTSKFSIPKESIDIKFWREIIKQALPLSFAAIFSIVAFKIDTIFLSILKSTTMVGWYNAAYNLMQVLMFIPAVFTAAIFPLLSIHHISSPESLKFTYRKSFKYLSIISIPITVGTTLLANDIIILIYKQAFAPSTIALQILIWTVPFIFITYLLGTLLASINRQDLMVKVLFVVMIFNIILNLILIPPFGYIGASVVTVATEIVGLLLLFYYISRLLETGINCSESLIKPGIASVVMGCFIFLVKMNLFIEITIATAIYFTVLFLLKTFTKEDIGILKQIMGKE